MSPEEEHDDRYPTEEQIKRIKTWEGPPFRSLMEFVQSLWWMADWGWRDRGDGKYSISTGGWSGNEAIIEAMQGNSIFWLFCWYSSRRGGHYEFRLPELAKKKKGT